MMGDPAWDPGTEEHQLKTKTLNKLWILVINKTLVFILESQHMCPANIRCRQQGKRCAGAERKA